VGARLLALFVVVALFILSSRTWASDNINYSHKLDVQVRHDERSNRPSRNQYRLRFYPRITFTSDSRWSLNSFVVTGDSFASSHNTFGSDTTNYLHARRLFLAVEDENGKTEFGVIPTYKGRVSSSGLSKDGWITGIRNVSTLANDSALEIVIGQLGDVNAGDALDFDKQDDYIEIEYSAKMGQRHSYEISAERMTRSNFLRAEYRFKYSNYNTLFIEGINLIGSDSAKIVVGVQGEVLFDDYPIEYFSHYSYVSNAFGPRAELTEDFLGTGHGMSAEFSGVLFKQFDTEWFVRIDVIDSVSRVLTGVKVSFPR